MARASGKVDSRGVGALNSIIRLVGADQAEQNDEWADGRRYLGLDVLAKSRHTLIIINESTDKIKEDTNTAGAISA